MVLTNSRILSCEVWLILMRNTSAPASNRRRIIALSEEAGPSVARILIRRRRLMAWFRAPRLAAGQARPGPSCPAGWAGRGGGPARGAGRGARRVGQARKVAAGADRSGDARYPLRGLLFVGFGQLHGPGALFAGV